MMKVSGVLECKKLIESWGDAIWFLEVEAAINSHESILMSAVVGIPHEEWGEAIHAEVVLREGMQLDEAELVEFVKQKLGRFKAPKKIDFVDQLPISSVGKVLRREIRDKFWKSGRKVG